MSVFHGTGFPYRGQVSRVARGDHRRTGQVSSALWVEGNCTDARWGQLYRRSDWGRLVPRDSSTFGEWTSSNSFELAQLRFTRVRSAARALPLGRTCSVIQSRASFAPSGLSHQSSGTLLPILLALYDPLAGLFRTRIVAVQVGRCSASRGRSGSSVD